MMNVPNATHREFNMLVHPVLNSLKFSAYRMTGNEQDAQDLLQDTLYKSFRAFDQFQRDTNFKAWLFRIMVNTYISGYRKKKRQPMHTSYDEVEEYQLPSQEATAEIANELFPDEIYSALEGLPYIYRTVVLLSDIRDLSYQEIAQLLGIPLGTVMSRLHRGRAYLKKRLKNYTRNNEVFRSVSPAYGAILDD